MFIPKLLNNPLAFWSLINFEFLLSFWHTVHFDKSFILPFFVLQRLGFYFLLLFYIWNNTMTLFYKWTKIFFKLNNLLHFWFILSYSFRTLFIETNSSWLIFASIKALEINTCMLFNLDFGSNIVLSRFFFFLLIIDLNLLVLATTAQILDSIAELVVAIGIPKSKYRNWNRSSNCRNSNKKAFNII